MKQTLIHPTDWESYVRYARNATRPDWRPPLVTFAITRFDKAVDSLTPRQFGLFLLFVFGYAASALVDPEAGPQSLRAFPDDPATWRRRVVHKVTSDDKNAWRNAGLIQFTTVDEPLIDGRPTAGERPELEQEQEPEVRRKLIPEVEQEQGQEREPVRERERAPDLDHKQETEPERKRERIKGNPPFITDARRRSIERTTVTQGVVCPECGKAHTDGLPGYPDDSFVCEIEAITEGHSLEEIKRLPGGGRQGALGVGRGREQDPSRDLTKTPVRRFRCRRPSCPSSDWKSGCAVKPRDSA